MYNAWISKGLRSAFIENELQLRIGTYSNNYEHKTYNDNWKLFCLSSFLSPVALQVKTWQGLLMCYEYPIWVDFQ